MAANLGDSSFGLAFDGARIWTANEGHDSFDRHAGAALPWTVTNVSGDFGVLNGVVFDGANIWVTDQNFRALDKLDTSGAILQTVTVGQSPQSPFSTARTSGCPTSRPLPCRSFGPAAGPAGDSDRQRPGLSDTGGLRRRAHPGDEHVGGITVSLWKAADLSVLGSFSTGISSQPVGVCSDGLHFWITLQTPGQVARF